MITIHDYDVPSPKTFYMVTQGVRFSWDSGNKSDSNLLQNGYPESYQFTLGESDKALLLKLIKAGPDHGKFMRQLPVVIDLTSPAYWWREMDTYRVGTARNSSSQMHTVGKHEFDYSMFSWEDIDGLDRFTDVIKSMLYNLNLLRDNWIESGKRKGPNNMEWRAMLQAIPDSFNYRSMWSANYQVLRNIFHARKAHRLAEWRVFCEFIAQLPHADLITVEK